MNELICLNPSDTNAELLIPICHFLKGFVFAYVFPVQAKNAQTAQCTTQVYTMRLKQADGDDDNSSKPEVRITFGLTVG